MGLVYRAWEPAYNPWIIAGAVGVAACVVFLGGAVLGRKRPGLLPLGVISALISGVGWGSWLFVGVAASIDDPVINITGLLVAPGLLFGFLVLGLSFVPARNRARWRNPAAHWFALGYLVLIVLDYGLAWAGTYSLFQFTILAPFALGAWQVARAHLTPAEPMRLSRILALLGGYLVMLGPVGILVGPVALLARLGIVLTAVAAFHEWRESRPQGLT